MCAFLPLPLVSPFASSLGFSFDLSIAMLLHSDSLPYVGESASSHVYYKVEKLSTGIQRQGLNGLPTTLNGSQEYETLPSLSYILASPGNKLLRLWATLQK